MINFAKNLWLDFGVWLCSKGWHRWVRVTSTDPATKDCLGCTLTARICMRCAILHIDQVHYRTLYEALSPPKEQK